MAGTFEIRKDGFYLNGEKFRLLAGAVHYFRVPREYWRDRLQKLKACGFNAVETYIAWNAHEKREGQFDFGGMLDVAAFLKEAQELGLWAVVRPGPYICSEWEFGGLPWWLLSKPGIRLRCMNEPYMEAVDRFFDRLVEEIGPLQITRGGNILMMQVENEYGSYGDDKEYLTAIRDGLIRRGVDVPLFTSDGATDFMLTGGTLPDVHKTANFGARAKEQFIKLRQFQPDGPLMCAEFWNGWFDHWTEAHHARKPEESAQSLKEILEAGASLSCYMFHGGTNFGFMNGANGMTGEDGRIFYEPTINSYDDDAPVNEWGGLTKKYELFKEILAGPGGEPEPTARKAYGRLVPVGWADLLDNADKLAKPVKAASPLTMEELGQGYGFVLYKTHVLGPREEMPLVIQEVRDRAHIFVNGELKGIQYRNDHGANVKLAVPKDGADVAVLVENMGRINYGYNLMDKKGVTEGIRLGQAFVYGWEQYALGMEDISGIEYRAGRTAFGGRPVMLKYELDIEDEPADTFVKLPSFSKGVIFVNGKPLSRYWKVGPQKSAYLPAPFLRRGVNDLVVLELDGYESDEMRLDSEDELG